MPISVLTGIHMYINLLLGVGENPVYYNKYGKMTVIYLPKEIDLANRLCSPPVLNFPTTWSNSAGKENKATISNAMCRMHVPHC